MLLILKLASHINTCAQHFSAKMSTFFELSSITVKVQVVWVIKQSFSFQFSLKSYFYFQNFDAPQIETSSNCNIFSWKVFQVLPQQHFRLIFLVYFIVRNISFMNNYGFGGLSMIFMENLAFISNFNSDIE